MGRGGAATWARPRAGPAGGWRPFAPLPGRALALLLSLHLVAISCSGEDARGRFHGPSARPGYRELHGVFEPSGVVQLGDGRLLVVEDEPAYPFALISVEADRRYRLARIAADRVPLRLADLEGLTKDPEGRLYAITSHARKGSHKRDHDRERLVRFRVERGRITEFRAVCKLTKAIRRQLPDLKVASHYKGWREVLRLEIEALAFDLRWRRLLIGLRAPVLEGRARVIALENPDAAFAGTAPRLSLISLDLAGGGIRAMEYVPRLGKFLISARNETRPGQPFRFWSWSGAADEVPRPMHLPRVRGGLRKPEGLAPVVIGGRPGLLVVSDDGSAARGRPGHYLFLAYDPLVTARRDGG